MSVLGGCVRDVKVQDTDSATDGSDYFETETGETDPLPTTSAGDTEEDVDPQDYCELNPDEDFPGIVYVCSGNASAFISFDYYGDPEIPLASYLICHKNVVYPKDPGYVTTCWLNLTEYEFGPDIDLPGGRQIDACCLRDSPADAPEAFCRIDAAEEVCRGTSEGLNELRMQIPVVASTSELHDQLENLNLHLASAMTQTECSMTLGKGLIEAGDEIKDPVGWDVPDALDQDDGWPWFRDIGFRAETFELTGAEPSGVSCEDQGFGSVVDGLVGEGALEVQSSEGTATAPLTGGTFSFRRARCSLAACPFELQRLRVELADFAVGPLSFTDVSASLTRPALGLIQGTDVSFADHSMMFTTSFRVTNEQEPLFGGELVTVDLSNAGTAEARLAGESSLEIQRLEARNWPFTVTLTTATHPTP